MVRSQGLGSALRRDRVVVLLGLCAVTLLAWLYILSLARSMSGAGQDMNPAAMQSAMSAAMPWGVADFTLTFAMWAVMMVAMMTPSAAPMVLVFSKVSRQRNAGRAPIPSTALFLFGYLVIWAIFSLLATLLQWRLHQAAWLSPMLAAAHPGFAGALLVAAGVYQFTPLKWTCLARCRTPLSLVLAEWRDGRRGALIMGLRHGAFCSGCCWLLMGLLFVAGVMNPLWVAAIAAFILIEKTAPAGRWLGRAVGLLALGWGIWLLASPLL